MNKNFSIFIECLYLVFFLQNQFFSGFTKNVIRVLIDIAELKFGPLSECFDLWLFLNAALGWDSSSCPSDSRSLYVLLIVFFSSSVVVHIEHSEQIWARSSYALTLMYRQDFDRDECSFALALLIQPCVRALTNGH